MWAQDLIVANPKLRTLLLGYGNRAEAEDVPSSSQHFIKYENTQKLECERIIR